MRRWIKAGALIFVAMLVVAACEGPAGPTGEAGADGGDGTDGVDGTDGTDGTDGEDGEDGVSMPQLLFGYAPFNELAGATVATGDNNIPGRLHDLPFPAVLSNVVGPAAFTATTDTGRGFTGNVPAAPPAPAVPASRSWAQCQLIAPAGPDDKGIDMYSYMVIGGSSPMHSISVTGTGDDAVTMEMGHGFELTPDMEGVDWLSGRPNLKTGDYMWTLNAMDDAAQPSHVSVSWKFRVETDAYVAPVNATSNGDEATDTAEVDMGDFADFISSTFDPSEFTVDNSSDRGPAISPDGENNNAKALNLDDTDTEVNGSIGQKDGIDEATDVDMFWVGGLTPNSVLKVTVEGTTELPTGIFNKVSVRLYPHVHEMEKQAAIEPAMSEMDGDTYQDLDCGHYYLEVSSDAGEEGGYTLSWTFE